MGSTHRFIFGALLTSGAWTLATQTSRADLTAAWANQTTYTYTFSHVPDLDQRRFLLDGGGNMYCAPTCAINWAIYFANHGLPTLPPGPGNWQSQTRYVDATNAILDMAILMQTDGADGTGGDDGFNGLKAYLPANKFVVASQRMNHTWAPRFQTISELVFWGGHIMPVVGWYNEFKFVPGGMERLGGHVLTLNGGARSGGSMEIRWRDPARDEGGVPLRLLEQSIFATEAYAIEPRQRRPWMDGAERPYRTIDKIVDYGSGYLDGYYAIFPQFALTSQPDPAPVLNRVLGNTIGGSGQPQTIDVGLGDIVGSVAIHPDQMHIAYVGRDSNQLAVLNPMTGDERPVDNLGLGDPSRIVFGRKRGLYVLDDTLLRCVNVDMADPVVEAQVFTSEIPGAMTYDDARDEVVVLAPLDQSLMIFSEDLTPGLVIPIPGVPMTEDARMAWDPATGGCWIVSDASSSMYHVQYDSTTGDATVTPFSDPAVTAPVNVQVGDSGRLFVVAGGTIHEFDPLEGAGGWQPAPDPIFVGVQTGEHFQLARSRSNEDPTVQVPAEWTNLLPEEGLGDPIPDCTADLTGDDVVNVSDLLSMLAAWGPCSGPCYADINADGSVDVLDLLLMLSAWGPCP